MHEATIEARSYNLFGIASHNFWVLRDNKGQVIAQLHGLATDRYSNCFKPIGFFNDRLGVYEFKTSKNDSTFFSKKQRAINAYLGPKEEVCARWNKAAVLVESLNKSSA